MDMPGPGNKVAEEATLSLWRNVYPIRRPI